MVKRPNWAKQSISYFNVPRIEKKGLNIWQLHVQAAAHSGFMLMFINSGPLDLKIWVKWDSPYQSQSFSLQRSNDKKGIVFRKLEAWFVCATSHSILNPWSVSLSSMLQKQFVSRQRRISSLFTKKKKAFLHILPVTHNEFPQRTAWTPCPYQIINAMSKIQNSLTILEVFTASYSLTN